MTNDETITSIENAAYTYRRADGTVERAVNADDAYARCPVLGRLALKAPAQAKILLELAAAGAAKMQAEELTQKNFLDNKEDAETEFEPKTETLDSISVEPEHEDALVPELQSGSVGESVKLRDQIESPLPPIIVESATKEVLVREHAGTVKIEQQASMAEKSNDSQSIKADQKIDQLVNEVYGNYKTVKQELVQPPAEISTIPRPVILPNKFSSESDELKQAVGVPEKIIQNVERTIDIVKVKAAAVLGIRGETSGDNSTEQMTEQLSPRIEPELIGTLEARKLPDEIAPDAFEPQKQFFEAEVVDTYQELLLLTDSDQLTYTPIEETLEGDLEVDLFTNDSDLKIVDLTEPELKPDLPKSNVPKAESLELVPLIKIIEKAEVQPLKEIFVHLTNYLEVAEKNENDFTPDSNRTEPIALNNPEESEEFYKIGNIMRDINEVLPGSYYRDQETGEQRIKINPELTEKLLKLLRTLGYEQPKEALVEFISLYGLDHLLLTLQQLCNKRTMAEADEEKELLVNSFTAIQADEEFARKRFDKALSGFVMQRIYPNNLPDGNADKLNVLPIAT